MYLISAYTHGTKRNALSIASYAVKEVQIGILGKYLYQKKKI
ncbi:protein of unknown function [Candidatus Nitrosocosmicus franklandus]|uniref:Uncharacterized protein n=1 Tax=Candidatus Nitrosocosmicus franklandianus TaxID=1798806 RepID=A0A484I6V0_9ARCH|nr:protein of unknown function [Candidatus Nitrosocosmicus franklandus]